MNIDFKYDSIAALIAAAEAAGDPLSALVLRQQAIQLEKTEQEVYDNNSFLWFSQCALSDGLGFGYPRPMTVSSNSALVRIFKSTTFIADLSTSALLDPRK